MTEPSILACDGVHKHFEEAGQRLEVLRGVELQVRAGETLHYTIIVDNLGPSWARGVAVKDVLESSGRYEVRSLTADRTMSCTYLPAGAPPVSTQMII